MSVYISPGNRKLGDIPSVSLDPRRTCKPGLPCVASCYAIRMMKFRKNIGVSWLRNTEIALNDGHTYFTQISRWLDKHNPSYFRYHVGGDIPNIRYFYGMANLALVHPYTKFLVFTKRYEAMGQFMESLGKVDNLRVMLSAWKNQDASDRFLFDVSMHASRKMPKKIAVSWVDDDIRVDSMSYNSTICKNDCSICHACWESDGDIILHKH